MEIASTKASVEASMEVMEASAEATFMEPSITSMEAFVEYTSTEFYFLLPWKLSWKLPRKLSGFHDSFHGKPFP